MTYVYFLINQNKHKIISYIGWTFDLKRRLKSHNSGKGAKFTRGRKWKLIYYEILKNKSDALKREHELKKDRKLRNYIKLMFKKNYNEK